MRAFLQHFFARLSRMTEFANAGNLGDALRLMAARHLAEVDQRQRQTIQRRTRKLMQRPRQFHAPAAPPELRRQRRGGIPVANCFAPQGGRLKETC